MKSIIDNYQLPCIKRLHIVGSHEHLTANAEYSLLELLGDKFLASLNLLKYMLANTVDASPY